MSADPFTAADPLYRRAMSQGVRRGAVVNSGRVWRGTLKGHLIAAVIGVLAMSFLMGLWR